MEQCISSRRRVLFAVAALAMNFSGASAYQGAFMRLCSGSLFSTVPRFLENGLVNGTSSHGRSAAMYLEQIDRSDQQPEFLQASVDDYLVFLERRYQRLYDEEAKPESSLLVWNWLLERRNEPQNNHHKNALHVLGVTNLASRKLLQRNGINSRSIVDTISFPNRWLSELNRIFTRFFSAFFNPRKLINKLLKASAVQQRIALSVTRTTASVMLYLAVHPLAIVIFSEHFSVSLLVIASLCSSRNFWPRINHFPSRRRS